MGEEAGPSCKEHCPHPDPTGGCWASGAYMYADPVVCCHCGLRYMKPHFNNPFVEHGPHAPKPQVAVTVQVDLSKIVWTPAPAMTGVACGGPFLLGPYGSTVWKP